MGPVKRLCTSRAEEGSFYILVDKTKPCLRNKTHDTTHNLVENGSCLSSDNCRAVLGGWQGKAEVDVSIRVKASKGGAQQKRV